jgi:hypothetical protein
MPRGFQRLRRFLIVATMAIFVGLPFGLVFLEIVSNPSRFLLNLLVLVIFAAAAGFLGNQLANKINRYDSLYNARASIRTLDDHESKISKVSSSALIFLPLFLILELLYLRNVSVSTIVIEAAFAIVFFVLWRRTDPHTSAALQKLRRNLFFYLLASLIVSLIKLKG